MKRISLLISRNLLMAIGPYFLFSWALLTVILFLQQASRYSDLFFSVDVQGTLVWQLMIGLVPSVIAFTCPMAVLVGTVIGLSRMQGDSELVAIRAAGVSNVQIAIPVAILGLLLSAFAFFINVQGVPIAAAIVRRVATQSAIAKLESPIEPGVFYSEIDGFTILAEDADASTGQLKQVFIAQRDDPNGVIRFISSDIGRMDLDAEATELVLENARVTTVPVVSGQAKYAFEIIKDVRIALKTKRAAMLDRLSNAVRLPDELGLKELSDFVSTSDGKEKVEAQIIFQRRIVMSLTPLIFCLLGTVLVLRFRRGGRGFGIFLALAGLIGYYLAVFLGEQLARTGYIGVYSASIFPIAGSMIVMLWIGWKARLTAPIPFFSITDGVRQRFSKRSKGLSLGNRFVDLTSGLRDLDLARDIVLYFLLSTSFLLAVFIIFTAFETWRFASGVDGGGTLLTRYLVYLVPFAYLQIAPSAAMIAAIAAYSVKSRNNELVTWAAAGQSVYRLMVPCIALVIVLGAFDLLVQEYVAPNTNRRQDELRTRLRSSGMPDTGQRQGWTFDGGRIIAFERTGVVSPGQGGQPDVCASDNVKEGDLNGGNAAAVGFASDNERRPTRCPAHSAANVVVIERSKMPDSGQILYRSNSAIWKNGEVVLRGNNERVVTGNGEIVSSLVGEQRFQAVNDPFRSATEKPNHLSIREMWSLTDSGAKGSVLQNYLVAINKRFAALVLPLIIVLFALPWSISLRHISMVASISTAVGIWLLFTGTTSVFEQYGINGSIAPGLAIWAPLALFGLIGAFFISRMRT